MYSRPANLDEALGWMAERGARAVAGGTDVFPTAGGAPLSGRWVDVSRISAFRRVAKTPREVRLGGAMTWTELVSADLPPAFDALKAAAREVGAIQIQNRGTIAGNVCNASPAADGIPPLLILDADVELASRRGVRRLPLADFLVGARRTRLAPDELMTAILVPTPAATLRSAFFKLGARRYLVISIAMVAVALQVVGEEVRDARIAVGACSAVARRLPSAERRLIGERARAGLADRDRARAISTNSRRSTTRERARIIAGTRR